MWGSAVFFQRFRHFRFQLLNAGAVRRMTGKELGWLSTSGIFHSLPKADALPRIVTSSRHIKQSNLIGFRLVFATKLHEKLNP